MVQPENKSIPVYSHQPITPSEKKEKPIHISELGNLVSLPAQAVGIVGLGIGGAVGAVVGGLSVFFHKNEDPKKAFMENVHKASEWGGKASFYTASAIAFPLTILSYALATEDKLHEASAKKTFKGANIIFYKALNACSERDDPAVKENLGLQDHTIQKVHWKLEQMFDGNSTSKWKFEDLKNKLEEIRPGFFELAFLGKNTLTLQDMKNIRDEFEKIRADALKNPNLDIKEKQHQVLKCREVINTFDMLIYNCKHGSFDLHPFPRSKMYDKFDW